jgi:hypothetical protein
MNILKCKYQNECRNACSDKCDDCQHNEAPSFYKPKPFDLPPDLPPKIEITTYPSYYSWFSKLLCKLIGHKSSVIAGGKFCDRCGKELIMNWEEVKPPQEWPRR